MSAKETTNDKKLRILALHGYRQNCDTFRQKTGSFRKVVNKWAEFIFVTAPHRVIVENHADDTTIDQSNENEQYGWFFNKEDSSFRGTREGGPAIGFSESINLIEETFVKQGPFDGIWGFSQGACFAALLCDLQQRGQLKAKFNFAILVAGFKSGATSHSDYFNECVQIPTLHVFGENDNIIPFEMSVKLGGCFCNPVIVKHVGGHFVPASSEQKEAYRDFFRSQFLIKNSGSLK